ncbi:MAG TPA: hypothetical protein VF032_02030 [Thermoleophilaceae bacterium]
MAQTQAQRSAAAKKAAATRRRNAAAKRATAARRGPVEHPTPVERTTELSEHVLDSIRRGEREALEAVRKFMETVDRTLPARPAESGPSRRQELVDSALEMAERLVKAQYDFLTGVVHSAGKSLRASDDKTK